MRLSIPLVVYALGWFGAAFSRPIYPDDDLEFQVSRSIQAEGSQLRELEADNYSSRELLNIISELDERDILQELEARAKISKAAQTARKQAKAAQANSKGKAMGPISPAQMAKKAAGKVKQNTNNANRKAAKNARNQANGNTRAAAQQRANKATNAQWPARNAVVSNGRNTVSGKDVRKTVFESNKRTASGNPAFTNGGTAHPHTFNNFPNRQRAGPNGANLNYAGAGGGGRPIAMTGRGKEYALTSPTFTGGNPGAMRVITQNGDYKGVVSHDPSRGPRHPNRGDLFKVNRREEDDFEDLSA